MLVVWARRIEDERRYRHLSRLGCCHVTMPCPLCTEPLEREP